MRKSRKSIFERIEDNLVKLIQEKGADRDKSGGVRLLLGVLKALSLVYRAVVAVRYALYDVGLIRRYPIGVRIISIGNVTAGGTGKTPVTELFARTLAAEGRRVAILSRGYRRREAPWWKRMFTQVVVKPLVVADATGVKLDAATGGDEPVMLANNLPGVAVVVDRNRVKAGRFAVSRFASDTIILDDGFQYQRLKHSVEVVLVDSTNPFGNGNMLPRGILREPAKNLRRADIIFLTKCVGDVSAVREEVRRYNATAPIVACNHVPKLLKGVWSGEQLPLTWLKGKRIGILSGIASPRGFIKSCEELGAIVVKTVRYADHHRYTREEIEKVLAETKAKGAVALVTTEKDAVRFPELKSPALTCLYLRIAIEILEGREHFDALIDDICFRKGGS